MKLDTTSARQLLRHVWDALVLIVTLFAGFGIPLRIVLSPGTQPLTPLWDGAVTLLFGIDLIIRLRRHLAQGRRASMWWWLGVDLVAALPFGRILGVPAASLIRLIKLLCVISTVRGWRRFMVIRKSVV